MKSADESVTFAKSIVNFNPSDESRFWDKVDKKGEWECWLWKAGKTNNGYGKFFVSNRTIPAHRFDRTLSHGEIPEGLLVCHKCDVRLCCNPNHLFIGTQQDNLNDAKAKNRLLIGDKNWARRHPELLKRGDNHWTRRKPELLARGDKSGARKHPESIVKGENHHKAKLTETDVIRLREMKRNGATYSDLVSEFSICYANVWFIVARKTWKHLP